MDERTLKRLAVIVVASIAIILLAKWGLTKTYSTLNEAAAAKKQASKPQVTQQESALPAQVEPAEAPVVSSPEGAGVGDAPAEPQPAASSSDATE